MILGKCDNMLSAYLEDESPWTTRPVRVRVTRRLEEAKMGPRALNQQLSATIRVKSSTVADSVGS